MKSNARVSTRVLVTYIYITCTMPCNMCIYLLDLICNIIAREIDCVIFPNNFIEQVHGMVAV